MATSATNTCMAITPMPTFRDLIHQTLNFEQFLHSIDPSSAIVLTFAVDSRNSGGRKPNYGRGPSTAVPLVVVPPLVVMVAKGKDTETVCAQMPNLS
ncbi:hypothetical protein ACS0TY_027783 [Phlomoides rotata]